MIIIATFERWRQPRAPPLGDFRTPRGARNSSRNRNGGFEERNVGKQPIFHGDWMMAISGPSFHSASRAEGLSFNLSGDGRRNALDPQAR
jgi:hypothetical protein